MLICKVYIHRFFFSLKCFFFALSLTITHCQIVMTMLHLMFCGKSRISYLHHYNTEGESSESGRGGVITTGANRIGTIFTTSPSEPVTTKAVSNLIRGHHHARLSIFSCLRFWRHGMLGSGFLRFFPRCPEWWVILDSRLLDFGETL